MLKILSRRFLIIAAAVVAVVGTLLLAPDSPLKALLFGNSLIVERPPIETLRPNPAIMKIAHRGTTIHGPENTLPAFETAIEKGMEYVEIDVRFTSDEVPVVIHDVTVDRTTNGVGKVSDFTLSELKELDAGSWFADEFVGTQIPTLEETLELTQGRICIQWHTVERPNKASIELFRRFGFDRECLLIAIGQRGHGGPRGGEIDLATARRVVNFWPDAPLMVSIKNSAEIKPILQKFPNIRAISVRRNHLFSELIDTAHAEGLLVMTSAMGHADRALIYQKLIELGADMFMLNHIDDFYTYLETGNTDTPSPQPPKNAEYLRSSPEQNDTPGKSN
jgi:glycerophosphoryl diester phosphodiesterase